MIKPKAPSTKLQAPEKLQTQKFKRLGEPTRLLGAWNLVFPWSFELEVWSFPAVWSLFAFISKFPCIADAELESTGAAIVFVVSDRDAVVEAKRADREVQAQAE